MTITLDNDHPLVTFFGIEIANHRQAVLDGQLDSAITYPPTLGSAVDSLMQCPDDMLYGWLGMDDPALGQADTEHYDALRALIDLALLIVAYGHDTLLVDVPRQSYEWAIIDPTGGVNDRFATEQEARDAVVGYPDGNTVKHVPDPTKENHA